MFTILPYLLALTGFSLAIWGKSLGEPISHFTFSQLVDEASTHASSIVTGFIKGINEEEHEVYQMKYDVFWNMEFPGILQLIATVCLGAACWFLYHQIQNDTSQRQDMVIKWILLGALAIMSLFFIYNGGKLILLSLLLLLLMLVIILFVPFFFIAAFKSGRTR